MKPPFFLIGLIIVAGLTLYLIWNFYFLDEIFTFLPQKGIVISHRDIFKEFQDASGLKIKYPAYFTNFEIENIEKLIPKEIIEKRNFKYLFGVIDPDGRARLTVSELEFEARLTPAEVIEQLKKDNQSMGAEVKVFNSQVDGNSVVYDAGYERKGLPLNAKVKLIFVRNPEQSKMKVYDVVIMAIPNEYSQLLPVIDKIIRGAGF